MKNMRRNIPSIFAILILGLLVLCSACVSPGSEKSGSGKPVVNVGLSQVPTQEISPYISFEEAKQEFGNYNSVNGSAVKLPVYYILSRDVDSSGSASTWLFGVKKAEGTELLMYDRTGWKIIPWNATLPSEEIVLDQVISPGTLFSRNKDVIFKSSIPSGSESRYLALKEGKYVITITSGTTSRTLTFNAITGELMSGNV